MQLVLFLQYVLIYSSTCLKISGILDIDLNFFVLNLQIAKALLRYLKRKLGCSVKLGKIMGNPFNCYVTEWIPEKRIEELVYSKIHDNVFIESINYVLKDTQK